MTPTTPQPTFHDLSASVDYATFTIKTGPRAISAWEAARAIQESEKESGQFLKPWKGFAYLGWASSHITVGRRLDGVIVRLSGNLAHSYWRKFYAMSDNATRLDLALTVRVEPDYVPIAHRSLREFTRWRQDHDRRIKRRLIDGGHDGSTFEVGSRASEQFGRIYDKHAEQPSNYPRGTWRYEYELKGDFSQAIGARLWGESDWTNAAGHLCANFFRERGITVPLAAHGAKASYTASKDTLSAEDRLNFLSRQIKPMVRELVLAVGERTVLDSLGLYEYTDYGQLSLPDFSVGVGNGTG